MGKGLLMVGALGALLVAPTSAHAIELGNWRVSATASIRYDWNQTGSGACEAAGPGRVTATVTGRSARFRMGYFTRAGYRHWALYPRSFRARGRVTAVDGTVNNPPEPGLSCTPIDKSGCGTRPVDPATRIRVSGKNSRGPVGAVVDVSNLLAAFEDLRSECNYGGLRDFSRFVGAPRGSDYGQVLVPLPLAAAIRRRAFTVIRTQTIGDRQGGLSARTVRRVVLRFTPA